MTNYAQIAAAVYQRCNHFDPYLPALSADLARAWGALFEKHRFNERDLLAAVDAVYGERGSGFRPLPADIITAARAIRRDRTERESLAERRAREDDRDAALEAQNKTRIREIADTVGAAKSIPARRLDPVAATPCTRPGRRKRLAEGLPGADGLWCGLCGARELVTSQETSRGVCEPCWPTMRHQQRVAEEGTA